VKGTSETETKSK